MNRAAAYVAVSQQLEAWRSLPVAELLSRIGKPPITHAVSRMDGSFSVEVGARWVTAKKNSVEIIGIAHGPSHWHTERIKESVTVSMQSPNPSFQRTASGGR